MTAAPPKPPGYTMPGYVIDRVMKKRGRLREIGRASCRGSG